MIFIFDDNTIIIITKAYLLFLKNNMATKILKKTSVHLKIIQFFIFLYIVMVNDFVELFN